MSPDHQIIFSISLVSHGHRDFVVALLNDLGRLDRKDIQVILTWNKGTEGIAIPETDFPFAFTQIENETPKGFAANHNTAFKRSYGANFVILNPDIRIFQDPFPALLALIKENYPCICAPIITNTENQLEDSARFFPSPLSLVKKAAAKFFNYPLTHDNIKEDKAVLYPDWIAGMFMVIPREIFIRLNGLSEKYHLYYEDVDFCARANLSDVGIYVSKQATAVHDARRESHKNPQFLKWHIKSALKFFLSTAYLRVILKQKTR